MNDVECPWCEADLELGPPMKRMSRVPGVPDHLELRGRRRSSWPLAA